MVVTAICCFNAAKRVPLIKFPNRIVKSLKSKDSSGQHGQDLKKVTDVKAVISKDSLKKSVKVMEDWELPAKYKRKPISDAEMAYINCGGPP